MRRRRGSRSEGGGRSAVGRNADGRHAGTRCDLFGWEAAALAGQVQAVAEPVEELFGGWQEGGGFLGHSDNIMAYYSMIRHNNYSILDLL